MKWNFEVKMAGRVKKNEFIEELAKRMETDEATAERWVEGFVETLFDNFRAGKSVTLTGFGSFYVRPERETWVFKFNPAQRLRALLGWSSTFKG